MENTTLYYFFSTHAQVMAAISALLAIFTQFKINGVKKFLIGDGQSTFERMNKKEPGYDLETDYKKYLDRLRDSLFRESIKGIHEVIKVLAKNEQGMGRTKDSNPRGLQYLEERFQERINQIREIKSLTVKSIVTAFISIFSSIISILFVENIVFDYLTMWIVIGFIMIVTLFSLMYTLKGVYSGLRDLEDV